MDLNNITTMQATLLVVLIAWDLVWKGLALWRAAQNKQKVWFVLIIIINSVGILPIIYLLTNKPAKTKS